MRAARYAKLVAVVVAMLFGWELQAATQYDTKGIPFGSATLLPAVHTELRYDDNIFESANDESDSMIAVLIPSLSAQLELGNSLRFIDRTEFNDGLRESFVDEDL